MILGVKRKLSALRQRSDSVSLQRISSPISDISSSSDEEDAAEVSKVFNSQSNELEYKPAAAAAAAAAEEIAGLKNQVNELKSHNTALQYELENKDEKIDELEKQDKQQKETIDDLRQQLADAAEKSTDDESEDSAKKPPAKRQKIAENPAGLFATTVATAAAAATAAKPNVKLSRR